MSVCLGEIQSGGGRLLHFQRSRSFKALDSSIVLIVSPVFKPSKLNFFPLCVLNFSQCLLQTDKCSHAAKRVVNEPLHSGSGHLPQSLQVVSGLISLGVGIIFAVTQGVVRSLCGLFRIPYVNGILVSLPGGL